MQLSIKSLLGVVLAFCAFQTGCAVDTTSKEYSGGIDPAIVAKLGGYAGTRGAELSALRDALASEQLKRLSGCANQVLKYNGVRMYMTLRELITSASALIKDSLSKNSLVYSEEIAPAVEGIRQACYAIYDPSKAVSAMYNIANLLKNDALEAASDDWTAIMQTGIGSDEGIAGHIAGLFNASDSAAAVSACAFILNQFGPIINCSASIAKSQCISTHNVPKLQIHYNKFAGCKDNVQCKNARIVPVKWDIGKLIKDIASNNKLKGALIDSLDAQYQKYLDCKANFKLSALHQLPAK